MELEKKLNGTSEGVLANPRAIEQCCKTMGDNPPRATGGSYAMAKDMIAKSVELPPQEEINNATLNQIADSILMHVINWGKSQAPGRENEEVEYHTDADYDPDSPGRDLTEEFKTKYESTSQWADIETILFASQVLWLLANAGRGLWSV